MAVVTTEAVQPSKLSVSTSIGDLLLRIQGEYREMPGLSVTAPQAARLWGVDQPTASLVLSTLVQLGLLRRTTRDTYIRA